MMIWRFILKLCKIINLQQYKKNNHKRFTEILEMIEPIVIVDVISYEDIVKQYKEYYSSTETLY